jgi:tRNA(Ile)-lysidine synthase
MLLQQFQQNLTQNFSQLSTDNCRLLLAVSGGIDSVVMTDLFYRSGFEFSIAHCNFQLRGEESLRDELFMISLGEKYNRKVLVKKFDTKHYAADNKISIQEAARKLRYGWFEEVSSEQSAVSGKRFIATAHNADDNIETMLMFLFRGTGIHGLTGINSFDSRRKIIRPLVFATREQIKTYAKENDLDWVEDSSNFTDKYTRNFFRHKIIPLAEEHFVNAKGNLLHTIHRLKDAEVLFTQSIELHKKKLLEFKGNEIHIPLLKLRQSKPLDTIIWEIIKDYNFSPHQVDELKKLFDADNSSYVQSSTHRIIKNRNWLIIAPNETKEAGVILIEENTSEVVFQSGVLNFEKLAFHVSPLTSHKSIAQLDAKHIQFPLLLRKWKQGDYFYPLGMQKNLPAGRQGKKKLARFFIDEKLSAVEKENTWVLEMNKKIIWIINHRIDDRFKITASTKEVLKISFNAAKRN